MDTKILREIQRKEKMSPYLQELGKEFYKEFQSYVGEIHSKYLEYSKREGISKLSMALGELENIKVIVSDIYETREKKIVNNALYYIKSDEEMGVENLTLEEEEMLRKIIDALRERRSAVLKKIIGEVSSGPQTESKDPPQTSGMVEEEIQTNDQQSEAVNETSKKEPLKKATIRLLKDLPSIVGVDGNVYGSFKKEDVVTLPEPNAKVLVSQDAAEYIDVT